MSCIGCADKSMLDSIVSVFLNRLELNTQEGKRRSLENLRYVTGELHIVIDMLEKEMDG